MEIEIGVTLQSSGARGFYNELHSLRVLGKGKYGICAEGICTEYVGKNVSHFNKKSKRYTRLKCY